jgi:hypothetical protein
LPNASALGVEVRQPIRDALADGPLHCRDSATTIINAAGDATVITKLGLGKVALQMLLAAMPTPPYRV